MFRGCASNGDQYCFFHLVITDLINLKFIDTICRYQAAWSHSTGNGLPMNAPLFTLPAFCTSGGPFRPGTPGSTILFPATGPGSPAALQRSEEHTSELQSRGHLVCRLLLEKKKTQY